MPRGVSARGKGSQALLSYPNGGAKKTRNQAAAEACLCGGERILGITHFGKIKPVRRANRPAGCAISCFERGLHVRGYPSPGPDALERADEATNLIVQE